MWYIFLYGLTYSLSPASPFPLRSTVQYKVIEYSQVVRHHFLVSACKDSNHFTPDYEHSIDSVENELTTTREAIDCCPWAQLVTSQKTSDLKPQGLFLFFSFSNNYHDVHKQICSSHEIVVNLSHAYLLPLNFRRAKLSCCPWPSISITKPNRKPRLAISRVYIAYWNIMKIQPKGGQRKLRFLRE